MSKDYWVRLSMHEREMIRTALLMYIIEIDMPEDIRKKWRKLYDDLNY